MTDRDGFLHRTADIAADFLGRRPQRPIRPTVDLKPVSYAAGE
jgi:hypothetical protein